MYAALLLVLGCLLLAAAVATFRLGAPGRERFRGAVRVTGEVVEVLPGDPETSRIRFRHQGQDYFVSHSPSWDSESESWNTGYSLGAKVRLLVPPDRPRDAAPAFEVKAELALPMGIALLGSGALGFGLLLATESLAIGGPVIAAAWVAGVAFFVYISR